MNAKQLKKSETWEKELNTLDRYKEIIIKDIQRCKSRKEIWEYIADLNKDNIEKGAEVLQIIAKK